MESDDEQKGDSHFKRRRSVSPEPPTAYKVPRTREAPEDNQILDEPEPQEEPFYVTRFSYSGRAPLFLRVDSLPKDFQYGKWLVVVNNHLSGTENEWKKMLHRQGYETYDFLFASRLASRALMKPYNPNSNLRFRDINFDERKVGKLAVELINACAPILGDDLVEAFLNWVDVKKKTRRDRVAILGITDSVQVAPVIQKFRTVGALVVAHPTISADIHLENPVALESFIRNQVR